MNRLQLLLTQDLECVAFHTFLHLHHSLLKLRDLVLCPLVERRAHHPLPSTGTYFFQKVNQQFPSSFLRLSFSRTFLVSGLQDIFNRFFIPRHACLF
jgi:hypothetical protein